MQLGVRHILSWIICAYVELGVMSRLTGVVAMQTVLYFRMFSTDYWTTKAEVRVY